jgi:hypothetical protein
VASLDAVKEKFEFDRASDKLTTKDARRDHDEGFILRSADTPFMIYFLKPTNSDPPETEEDNDPEQPGGGGDGPAGSQPGG